MSAVPGRVRVTAAPAAFKFNLNRKLRLPVPVASRGLCYRPGVTVRSGPGRGPWPSPELLGRREVSLRSAAGPAGA